MAIFSGPWQWRHIAFGALVAGNVALCILPPNVFFHRYWAMHAHHWMLAHFALTFLLLAKKEYRMMTANVLACMTLALFLRKSFEAGKTRANVSQSPTETALKFALFQYRPAALFAETVRLAKADIALIQQCPDTAFALIKENLGPDYRFLVKQGSQPGYATACFSKIPFQLEPLGAFGLPDLIKLRVMPDSIAQRHLQVYCLWLPPASSDNYSETLQAYREAIGGSLGPAPVFVCGNLHDVPWSNGLTVFRDSLHLFDSRHDLTGGLFSVPEDHVFYSIHWNCLKFKSVRAQGGSEMGIMGEYQLKPEYRRNVETPSPQF